MSTDEHVTPALLAYLDNELAPDERRRVEDHLGTCAECAAQLETLRTLRLEVGVTLDAALAPLRLSRDADDRIRAALRARTEGRPSWLSVLWARRGVLANLALAVLLVVSSIGFIQTMAMPATGGAQETLVLGQKRLSPGSEAALRVIVRNAEAALPLAGANVVVSLVGATGAAREVYRGVTGESGTADVRFAVPAGAEGGGQLVVETRSGLGEERIVAPIEIARSYRIYISSDRPAYKPGQTVYVRALVLDAVSLKPVTGRAVELSLTDAEGRLVGQRTAQLSEYGIAGDEIPLDGDAPEGAYRLEGVLGDTVSSRELMVARYVLPDFRVTVETERSFYAPGEAVRVTVGAETFYQRAVSGADVTVRGITEGGADAGEITGETDAEGRAGFELEVPAQAGVDGLFYLEVEVRDSAGRSGRLRHIVPVAEQPLVVTAMPESGRLVPGVENAVYLAVAYPDGAPAQAQLAMDVQGQHYELETGSSGLAILRFSPEPGTALLRVEARDAWGREASSTIALGAEALGASLLLRAERARYTVGETLKIEALSSLPDGEVIYVDVERAGQMVAALAMPLEGGRATAGLDLDTGLIGALALRAYALSGSGQVIEDTRLVVVDGASTALQVGIASDREAYSPGETARIEISTLDAAGTPVASALGVAVVDESVYALDALPVGFARAYVLLDRQLVEQAASVPGLDVGSLMSGVRAVSQAEQDQDLAARAAWAGVERPAQELWVRRVAFAPDEAAAARAVLGRRLALLSVALAAALAASVARGLMLTAVARAALRRLGWGLLGLAVLSPALIVGGVMGYLAPALGAVLFLGILGVAVALLLTLWVSGWVERAVRTEIIGGLTLAYLVTGAALAAVAARGVSLPLGLSVAVVVAHLLCAAALAWFGQGLVVEGRRRAGWAWTTLGLLLVLVSATLPAVPEAASELSQRLGSPELYLGPIGWLSGCAPQMSPEVAVEATAVKEVEVEATPEALPTMAATPTAVVPAEPYPLRQLFPETLYWIPEALSDDTGRWVLDLPLADSITTWRITALASTAEGAIGAATHELVARKAFFVEVEPPATVIRAGEAVTLELRATSELPAPAEVSWEVALDGAGEVVSAPERVRLEPGQAAGTTIVLRPGAAGRLTVEVMATAGTAVDRVAVTLDVEP